MLISKYSYLTFWLILNANNLKRLILILIWFLTHVWSKGHTKLTNGCTYPNMIKWIYIKPNNFNFNKKIIWGKGYFFLNDTHTLIKPFLASRFRVLRIRPPAPVCQNIVNHHGAIISKFSCFIVVSHFHFSF